MKRKIRKIAAGILIAIFSFFPFNWERAEPANLWAEDNWWEDEERYFLVDSDRTWHKEDNLIFEKSVVVARGAKLTIEKGATIKFNLAERSAFLFVADGIVLAEGTREEKITFTSDTADGMYNGFSINFQNNPVNPESLFRHTVISRGGYQIGQAFSFEKRKDIWQKAIAQAGGMCSPAFSYNSGKLKIENSEFLDNFCQDFSSYWDGDSENYLELANSNFSGDKNVPAVVAVQGCPSGHWDEDEEGNSIWVADNCPGKSIRLINNWYGDANGPYIYEKNENTEGKEVMSDFLVDGWRKNSLILDPLILIPGIMGSARKISSGGELVLDPIIFTYSNLTASLEKNGYEKDKNLFDFPYEWRKENSQTAGLLRAKIEAIREKTGQSRVDLAAHSMGGLVAREYVEKLGGENKIDQLITLGTPHRGAPKTYLSWESGQAGIKFEDKIIESILKIEAFHAGYYDLSDCVTFNECVKLKDYIQKEIKSVRDLLPDEDYLFDIEEDEMRDYPNGYPRNEFLETLNEPANLQNLERTNFINIIGETDEKDTIKEFRVGKMSLDPDDPWAHGLPENFYDPSTDQGIEHGKGDETVPLESAKDAPADREILLDSSHGDLPTKAQCKIIEELAGILEAECQYVSAFKRITKMLTFGVFSPIDIQVVHTDKDGNTKKVGKDFENPGHIFEEIEGAYYSGFETENEFLTIPDPEDGEYKILVQGVSGEKADSDDRKYRIEINSFSEDKKQEEAMEISGEIGEGENKNFEIEVENGEIAGENKKDQAPPVTQIKISAEEGQNGWYLDDVEVEFSAADEEEGSGVEKIQYSLDNGDSWKDYSQKIKLSEEKIHLIKYFAIDKAGNKENVKNAEIKIDRTAPEAKLIFDVRQEKIAVLGKDNFPGAISAEMKSGNFKLGKKKVKRNYYLLADEAGHETKIFFEKAKDSKRRTNLSLKSIVYDDGQENDLTRARLDYKWFFIPSKDQLAFFGAHLRSREATLEAHYNHWKNETWIMSRALELDESENDDAVWTRPAKVKLSGLVVPFMETEKGKMKIGY